MKTIKVQVDEETYGRLAALRRKKGYTSIAAMMLDKFEELTPESEAEDVVRRARIAASKFDIGEEFELKDLFTPKVWNNLDHGVRTRAGKKFYAYVQAATNGIVAGEKNASRHQIYRVTSKPAG